MDIFVRLNMFTHGIYSEYHCIWALVVLKQWTAAKVAELEETEGGENREETED